MQAPRAATTHERGSVALAATRSMARKARATRTATGTRTSDAETRRDRDPRPAAENRLLLSDANVRL
jgi:hypothetical protein